MVQIACSFNIALNVAEPVFGEGTACAVTASFTAAATGAPFTPASIKYRIDDINSGASIVPATPVTPPAASVSIVVTGAQNALLSALRALEEHQLTVEVADSNGNTANAPVRWLVRRIFPA